MRLPAVIISVGEFSKDNIRIFAASNDKGEVMLPIFTDLLLAEKYKRHCVQAVKERTLNISITGNGSGIIPPLDLQLCVVNRLQGLTDIVQMAAIVQNITYIAVDPDPDSGTVLCLELDEFMSGLNIESEPSSGA